jgi:ATP-dependent Clp endopeptidase proteolytic subunit ClpP
VPNVGRKAPKGKNHVQSIIISKEYYNLSQARKWLKENGYKADGLDETDKSFRFRQYDPDGNAFRYRTQKAKKGITLLLGFPKTKGEYQMPNFEMILNQKTKKAELHIYDSIGGYFGIRAKDVMDQLKEAGDVEEIDLFINSPGGVVFEAITIFNALKQHKAPVNVTIMGLAASGGSIIAMAGDTVKMAKGSFIMIHRGSGLTLGNASDHLDMAGKLEKIDQQLAGIYADRTGKSIDAITAWMDSETWFNADEAVDKGFADETTETEVKTALNFSNLDEFICKWRNMPEKVAAFLNTNSKIKRKEKPIMSKEKETRDEDRAATIKEIKAACPDADSEFILSQLEAENTLTQVQSNWLAEMKKRLDAQKEEIEKLKAQKKRPGFPPVGHDRPEDQPGNPIEAFQAAVRRWTSTGMKKPDAIAHLARTEPDLHEAYIEAYNKEHKKGGSR